MKLLNVRSIPTNFWRSWKTASPETYRYHSPVDKTQLKWDIRVFRLTHVLAVKATTHLALDAAVVGAEHHHAENKKAAEAYKYTQNTGYNKPLEAEYGQQQDYGEQIQPPAAYGASQSQAQVQGNAMSPPPAYTPNNFSPSSTNLPSNEKSQAFTYQPQYQHPISPPSQQANVSPYTPQPSNLAQPHYAPITQDFKPPASPAPTYTSSSSYTSWDSMSTDLGQQSQTSYNTAPTPAGRSSCIPHVIPLVSRSSAYSRHDIDKSLTIPGNLIARDLSTSISQ